MLEPTEGFVEANGTRLHWLKWQAGDDALPPVLLLHATGFLARLWQPVAEALTSRYTVYAFDMRGHGASENVPSAEFRVPSGRAEYDWHNLVDDCAGFMDEVGVRGIPLVGHSSGGAAAAYLAATRPEYVSRLVLIEPIVRPGEFPAEADQRGSMAGAARKRRGVWASREEMIATYRERPTFAGWRGDVLRLYAEHGTFEREDGQTELKCSPEVEAQVYEQSASLGLWEKLPDIGCPTLVMRGGLTDQHLAMIAEGAAQRISGARSAVIEGAGHLAPMERSEAVAREILRFLEEPGNGK